MDTYQKLIQVEKILLTKNGDSINLSDAVNELIEFRRNIVSDINYKKGDIGV